MSLPRSRGGIGVSALIALALVCFVHVPVSGAEAPGAPAGVFASLDFDAPVVAPDAGFDAEAPLVTRSFTALLSLPRPQTRSIELTMKRVDPPLATRRPMALPALYASFGVLQALDFVSTRRGLSAGAHEANPLMRGVVSSGAGLMAAKAGVAAGSVFLSERMWKRNPAAALAMMVALNSAYAIVVAHNYNVVRGLK